MKADAVITRLDAGDQGVFGQLIAGSFFAYSGELPWRENKPSVSCILPDLYRCVWTWSPRFGRFMYLLLGTEPRTGIREHPANLMGDRALGLRAQLNGCIALGEKLGWIDGQKALLVSAPAVRRFEEYMGRRPFTLEIRNA